MAVILRIFLLAAFAMPVLVPPLEAEKPRFAVVNVPQAFDAYYVTRQEKEKVGEARAKLGKDPRIEQIKLTRFELLELRDQARDKSLSESVRDDYFRKFQIKAHELSSLQRDAANYIEEQTRIIDEAMVKKTKELLGVVRARVEEIAEAAGYDFVFEQGGTTSSQISALIYIRNADDLTEKVIAALNKDAPKDQEVAQATR